MNKVYLMTILIILSSCVSEYRQYYDRPINRESAVLNEYIEVFYKSQMDPDKGRNMYLEDSLIARCSYSLEEATNIVNDIVDSDLKEAYINMMTKEHKRVAINFSQLTKIKCDKVYPDNIIRHDIDHWSYRLFLPGFNKDSTLMVFYSCYYCGPLCSGIDLNIYKKVKNKWVVFKIENLERS